MIGDTQRPITTTLAYSATDLCKMVKDRDARIRELESMCDLRQGCMDRLIERDPLLAGEIMGGR
jgi:hypothetical protein